MKVDEAQIRDFHIHPLGFYYLILSSGEVTHRLHVYVAKTDFAAENVWHTHEFDLHSKVLAGSIKNHISEFIIDDEGSLTEFSVEYADGKSILNETGRKGKVSEIASFISAAGQEYFIRAGTIHRALSIDHPCVTHVSMRHYGGAIFSYGAEEVPFARRKVNKSEASEILEILSQNHLISS